MSRRDHVELLIAASALGAEILQPAKVLDIAVIENVIPSALVIHGYANELALGGHRMLVPECRIGRASPDDVQLRLALTLTLEPAERVFVLQNTAGKGIEQLIIGRDDDVGGYEVRGRRHRSQIRGNPQRRTTDHADPAVRPRLLGHPFDGVVAILEIGNEGFVKPFRAALAAHVLHDVGISRVGVFLGRVTRQLAQRILEVRRSRQHHRERALPRRQKDIGRELDAVAGGHGHFGPLRQCGNLLRRQLRQEARPSLSRFGRGRCGLRLRIRKRGECQWCEASSPTRLKRQDNFIFSPLGR